MNVGDRVRLIRTTDMYTRLKPGALGTVRLVDAVGTLHIDWDDGSSLGLIPGHDQFELVRGGELMNPHTETAQTTAEYAVVLGVITLGVVVILSLVAPAFVAVLTRIIASM